MPYLLLRALLFTPVLAFIAFGPGAAPPAMGASPCACGVPGPPCGAGVGPCSCGDTVVTSTKLKGSDPVLKTPCPCDGLFVASGVTLQIGGTIRGQSDNLCSGVVLAPLTTGVVVKTGKITGFSVAVSAADQQPIALGVTHSQFIGLQIVDNPRGGIFLAGSENTISSNVIQRSLEGLSAVGDHNVVSLNQSVDNVVGIFVEGRDNVVSRNIALRNEENGIELLGGTNSVDRNQSKYNGRAGFVIDGFGHTVTLNLAEANGQDGFTVLETAFANTFTRNRSNYNGGFGFDAGGADFYTDNRCIGNAAGGSDPPGLCF